MGEIRKLVLDVLKPHNPDIVSFAKDLANIKGVDGVNISLYEIDKEVENVKLTIEGSISDTTEIREYIKKAGGTIHSIDEVVAGKKIVEEDQTLHDRYIYE